ncbi:hypothetical protein [Paenibacillus lutrae]|uniref:hypothetical protein n=1 Tax=Paenibacillus lutrae TaxID=2078573 RepID=UPI001912F239|nr:hypothetical protein [Paenibacillus lutrae]
MPRLFAKPSLPAACPQCSGKRYISFNWTRFQHGDDAESRQVQRALRISKQLKHGWQYTCVSCGSEWYLGRDGNMMSYIHPSKAGLVERWNAGSYQLPDAIWESLRRIGAIPPALSGNGHGHAEVPCQVKTVRGEIFDMAYVSFQNRPPIDLWQDGRRIRFCDEIKEVSPSVYTLPADVRLATSQAQEIRMGYAPTTIQSADGRLFQLNWANDFFVSDLYRGEDFKLANLTGDWEQADMAGVPSELITYFVADWRPDMASVYLKPQPVQKTPSEPAQEKEGTIEGTEDAEGSYDAFNKNPVMNAETYPEEEYTENLEENGVEIFEGIPEESPSEFNSDKRQEDEDELRDKPRQPAHSKNEVR